MAVGIDVHRTSAADDAAGVIDGVIRRELERAVGESEVAATAEGEGVIELQIAGDRGTRIAADGGDAGVSICSRKGEGSRSATVEAGGVRGIDDSREGDILEVEIKNDRRSGGVLEAGRPIGARAVAGVAEGAAAEGEIATVAEGVGVFGDERAGGEGGGAGVSV